MKHKRYSQREHFNKKGVSPLIASVLLIGFAIMTAIIVITYSNQQTLNLQKSTENIISSSIPINFEIKQATSIDLQKIKLLVQSNSQTPINSFIIRLYGDKGTQSTNINGVNPLETSFIETTYNYNLVGNINKVELIPQTIEGKETFNHDVSLSTTIDIKQETAPECNQDLDNNGIPDCIPNEIITPSICQIINASWSDSSVLNSSYVDLVIESNNCNNINLPITYEEVDTLTPDDTVPEINLPQNITLKNNKAKIKWKAIWFDDQDGIDNSPDLMFTINGVSSNILEIKKINAPYSGLCPEVNSIDKREKQDILMIGEDFEKVKLDNNKEKVILHPNNKNIKDENGEFKQFVDLANVTYRDCKLDIDFENNKLSLVPQLIYNNTIYTPDNITLLDENILFDVLIDKLDYYKYSISITNIPDSIKSGIQNVKLVLQADLDLTKATFDNENIYLPNNIQLGFSDLIISGFAINIISPQEIIIENVTNLNNIYLDPIITITSPNINYDITADKFTDYISPYCTSSISYSCDSSSSSSLRVGYEPGVECFNDPFTFTSFNDRRAFQEYKTSSPTLIPVNAKIENVDFKHTILITADDSASSFSFMRMGATNPLNSYSCTLSSGLWSRITSSTQYAATTGFNIATLKTVNLGAQAEQDLQNDLPYGRFILGIKRTGSVQDRYTYGAGTHNIEVTYSKDLPKWSNPRTNTSIICPGDLVEFRMDWTEDVDLNNYTFTIDLNADNNFINSSAITTGLGWSGQSDTFGTSLNISRITATFESNVSWQFIACDSAECNKSGTPDIINQLDSFKVATALECDPCNPAPGTDWVIPSGRDITCQYKNINVDKNLTVGGRLVLDHVNLTLNPIVNLRFEILVNKTGELIVNNSIISRSLASPLNTFYIFNVTSGSNLTIENSNISDYGGGLLTNLPLTRGLYINTNNTIIRNTKLSPAAKGVWPTYGIYYVKSSNNILDNNTIDTQWSQADVNDLYGIYFLDSFNNAITNNEINTTQPGAGGDAIVINTGSIVKTSYLGFNISNNRINTNAKNLISPGTSGGGIQLFGSASLNNNSIFNNTILIRSDNSPGIRLTVSHNNTILNNRITTFKSGSYGLFLLSDFGNTVIDTNITTYGTNSYAINTNSAKNLTLINSYITSKQATEIFEQTQTSIILLNTTHNRNTLPLIDSTSFLNIKWFLYVTVLDSSLLPVQNANVIINDSFNNIVFTGLTDVDGKIPILNLSEFKYTGASPLTIKEAFPNYTIKATLNNRRAQIVTNLTNSTFIIIKLPDNLCAPVGDWLILGSQDIYCENAVINLDGNLTVKGNLTLNNITLIINDAVQKRYIYVDNSTLAKLVINASKINTTTSTNYYGFFANKYNANSYGSSNLSITYSNITDYGHAGPLGLERGLLIRSQGAIIKHSSFTPKENFAYGLNLANGTRMLIDNTTILIDNFRGIGIWMQETGNNIINNSLIYVQQQGGVGIQITSGAASNQILNSNITNFGSTGGIQNGVQLQSEQNILKNNVIITRGTGPDYSAAIFITSVGDQNKIIDSKLKADNDYDISVNNNRTNYIINTTFERFDKPDINIPITSSTENGTIITQWYLDVKVNDSVALVDTPIDGATVKAVNRTLGNLVFQDITDINGRIPQKILTEFIMNSTLTYYPSNYTIIAVKGIKAAAKPANMTDNRFVVLEIKDITNIPDVDRVYITNDGVLRDCSLTTCTIIPERHNNVTNLEVVVETTDLDQSCDLITQNATIYFCLNAPGSCIEPTANFKLKLDKVEQIGTTCKFSFDSPRGPKDTMQFYIPSGDYAYTVNITEFEIQRNPDIERDGAWRYMLLRAVGFIDDNKQEISTANLGTNPNNLNQFNPGTTRYRIENWGNDIVDLTWTTGTFSLVGGLPADPQWTPDDVTNTLQIDDDNQQSEAFTGNNLTNINLINTPRLFIYSQGLQRCISYSCESSIGREVLPTYFHIIPPLGLIAGQYQGTMTYTTSSH